MAYNVFGGTLNLALSIKSRIVISSAKDLQCGRPRRTGHSMDMK